MRVLFVHESPRPCIPVADALRSRYVVRLAHTTAEIREQLGSVEKLACLVCIPGRKLRAREVHDELVRLGAPPERMLILGLEEITQPDAPERIGQAITALDPPTLRVAS